jgi:hypothetical protein
MKDRPFLRLDLFRPSDRKRYKNEGINRTVDLFTAVVMPQNNAARIKSLRDAVLVYLSVKYALIEQKSMRVCSGCTLKINSTHV